MGFAWHLSLLLVSACIYGTQSFGLLTTNKKMSTILCKSWKTGRPGSMKNKQPPEGLSWASKGKTERDKNTTLLLYSQVPSVKGALLNVAFWFPVLRGCFECFRSLISCFKFPLGFGNKRWLLSSQILSISRFHAYSLVFGEFGTSWVEDHICLNPGMPWKAKWKLCQHFSKRMLEIGATI